MEMMKMKIAQECLPCIIRQAIEVANNLTDDLEKQQAIITYSLKELSNIDFTETAPFLSRNIHNFAKEISGISDPYKDLKVHHNIIAEEICKEYSLQKTIDNSYDKIDTACKLAIAGNIIDMGAYTIIEKHEIETSVNSCLNDELNRDVLTKFKRDLASSTKVMYLADNAGEIVFDKLLIKLMDASKLTYVVKAEAIVNDATMADAHQSGMSELVRVIDNGSDCQGTVLELCSKEFIEEFDKADLIISKGQANYETLSELTNKNIYFLLKAKCQSIAHDIGCTKGKTVLKNIF